MNKWFNKFIDQNCRSPPSPFNSKKLNGGKGYEKKNYLIEKLSKEEKAYIKRTVMTARNIYFRDNYDDINNTTMLLNDETAIEEESVLEKVLNRCQEEIESAVQFENVMSDPKLYNIVKELSLKEKEVLFYLYKKQKTMNETAQIMNLTRKTLRKYRNEAQKKIIEKLVNGGK